MSSNRLEDNVSVIRALFALLKFRGMKESLFVLARFWEEFLAEEARRGRPYSFQ